MMATVVVEVDSEPSCSIPNPTSPSLSHRFLDSKFYLLVVIGELVTEEHLRRAIANIERGEAAGTGDVAGSAPAPPNPPRPPAIAFPLLGRNGGSVPPPPFTHPHAGRGHTSRQVVALRFFIPRGSRRTHSPQHTPAFHPPPPTLPGGVRAGRAPAAARAESRPGSEPPPSPARHPRGRGRGRGTGAGAQRPRRRRRRRHRSCLPGDTGGWAWRSPHCGPDGSPERTKGGHGAGGKGGWGWGWG